VSIRLTYWADQAELEHWDKITAIARSKRITREVDPLLRV
jgi:hypothetical protein